MSSPVAGAGAGAGDLDIGLAFDPVTGIADLDHQLATLERRAQAAGMALDRHAMRNELQVATFRLRTASSIRLLLGSAGVIAIEVTPETSLQS